MTLVSPTLSKIPYGGFSPVRLQTRLSHGHLRQRVGTPAYSPSLSEISFPSFLSVVRACARAALGTSDTHHESSGPWLRHRLCCPAASLLTMATSETLKLCAGLCIIPGAFSNLRGSPIYSTSLWCRVASRTPAVSMAALNCFFTMNAGFALFVEARQPRLAGRTGFGPHCVTRLQNLLYVTTRFPC
jgi:hypothetical protein